jgi:hypothetical protein
MTANELLPYAIGAGDGTYFRRAGPRRRPASACYIRDTRAIFLSIFGRRAMKKVTLSAVTFNAGATSPEA